MTTRIRSRHGNVIAADFRPELTLSISGTSQILYFDEHVVVGRYEITTNGSPTTRRHYLIDLDADSITTL